MIKHRILIPSSTGGHLNEILQLKKIYKNYDYLIITEDLPINKTILKDYNHIFVKGNGKNRDFTFWKNFIVNFYLALKIIVKFKPTVIISTGSHTAVPFCYIGKLYGCKIIFILSFCRTKTRAKSADLIYPFADLFLFNGRKCKLYTKNLFT